MTVKTKMAKPVKKKDGSWDVVIKEVDEDIPDLGREHTMCNICGFGGYPECMSNCIAYLPADEQRRIMKKKNAVN